MSVWYHSGNMAIEIAELYTYPIKSCAPVPLQTAELTPYGIANDRRFMLVDADYEPLTQREKQSLALVQTAFETPHMLSITAPGQESLLHPLDGSADTGPELPITLFDKPATAFDQGGEVNAYFSEYLRQPVRLIRLHQGRLIRENTRVEGGTHVTAFADGYALSLGSLASLGALNDYLVEHGERPVPISRFRFNIVMNGAPEAWAEDYFEELDLGKLNAFVVRCIGRCIMPNVDQQTGELAKHGPITKALAKIRRGIDPATDKKANTFGSYLDFAFKPGATISVGDAITVTQYAETPNIQLTSVPSLSELVPQQGRRQHHLVSE